MRVLASLKSKMVERPDSAFCCSYANATSAEARATPAERYLLYAASALYHACSISLRSASSASVSASRWLRAESYAERILLRVARRLKIGMFIDSPTYSRLLWRIWAQNLSLSALYTPVP